MEYQLLKENIEAEQQLQDDLDQSKEKKYFAYHMEQKTIMEQDQTH